MTDYSGLTECFLLGALLASVQHTNKLLRALLEELRKRPKGQS